jgi:hypothetical protein
MKRTASSSQKMCPHQRFLHGRRILRVDGSQPFTVEQLFTYLVFPRVLGELHVDVSYTTPQAYRIINIALHPEYPSCIVFI